MYTLARPPGFSKVGGTQGAGAWSALLQETGHIPPLASSSELSKGAPTRPSAPRPFRLFLQRGR